MGIEIVRIFENKKVGEIGKGDKIVWLICVVVDEVDGVVFGFGVGGEGGFVRVFIDFVIID